MSFDTVVEWHSHQVQNLQVAYEFFLQAYNSKQVPALDQLERDVQMTLIYTAILATILVVRPLRRVVFQTLESILTVILLLILILLVLGLPFGVIYIAVKGLTFLSISLLRTFPQLQAVVDQAQAAISSALSNLRS
uniref:Uncharacterized protein n=1 Tax=Chlamydomonas leiostraca TaxID=1034604 RepID=A0A7S0WN73_9CHLO|mmetsp:Transcript_20180/g.51136  ORF Transcript_20180/g.51136 Transcript_20180/m.51136 type:complete len:136 (+) Transcript_20180:238-645(+)